MRVIVTGSEGLIGKEVVKYLEKEGYKVVHCDIFLEPEFDMSDETYAKAFFHDNHAEALVNCFAYNPQLPSPNLLNQSLEGFKKHMDINLTSLFLVCREFAKNNKYGSIVNFSSTYGVVSPRMDLYGKDYGKDIGYSVSKAGVIMLTKQFATHLAPNIRVNCIVPGGVQNKQDEYFQDKYSKQCPMGRMMKKNEIAPLVEFLISKKSSYCTGGVFTIDGGWTVW